MDQKEEINNFWTFCNLREDVRKNKEKGLPQPWTNDPILQRHKFTNINRLHDRGTQLLINLCNNIPHELFDTIKDSNNVWKTRVDINGDPWQEREDNTNWYYNTLDFKKFCASAIYRFSGSNNALITMMQNNKPIKWFVLLKSVTPLFNMTAYQANWPNGKDSGRNFMLQELTFFCHSVYYHFKKHMSIMQARDIMCDGLAKVGYKRMRFQTTEIAKDLSMLTDLVDADSECPMNVGAIKGLKYIFNSTSSKNLIHLVTSAQNPGYNTQILEHALCEYSKYRDYQTGVRKSHQKVYKPTQTSYNNNTVIINQTKEANND